ncbi:MAG: nitroreductase family protein [Actinomycetota bacterium]
MERTSASPLTNSVFLDRWSPRSFSDKPVTDDLLAALFEAARWAPSWMNNQPWLFLYETDGPDRADMEAIISEFNRGWAAAAPVIGLIVSRPGLEGFMARTAEFDTGAAVMSLTHQATMLGLAVHLMGGIELDLAYEKTGLDRDEANIMCAFALGCRGDGSNLSDKHRAREVPSPRMPSEQFAFRGLTPGPRPES